jgi:5'-nucleotidase
MKNTLLISLLLSSIVFAVPIHFALVNDCHSVVEAWGFRDPSTLEASIGGYARAIHIVDSLRAEYPNLLFLHAGDVITGDFLSTLTIGRATWDLWMQAGVRAFAVGNHEFEYGVDMLDSVLGEIDVPLVCANLDATGFPNIQASIEPYRIFAFPGEGADSVRIAVFGVCTEETDDAGWTEPLDLGDVVVAIDTFGIPPGADAAIALTHLDISDDHPVAAIPFISAVLGGHDHSVPDAPIWNISGADSTPILKSGPMIIRVGHLIMDYNESTGLSFISWNAIPIVAGIPESPTARALLDSYRDTIAANPFIGFDPYETVAFIAESSIPITSTDLADSGWNDSPQGNMVTEAYRSMLGTKIGVEGRGAMRMSIRRGPVTFADLYRIAPVGIHPGKGLNSRLIRVIATGQQLKTMMEYALFGSSFSSEVFPEFSGMRVEFNPGGPFLNKINTASWVIDGMLWHAADTYLIAGTEMLEYAMGLVGISATSIVRSDTTVWEAISAYCTSPDFTPAYRSDGRFRDITVGITEIVERPIRLNLRAWPNPFNASVNIESGKPARTLEIFDLAGKLVKNIAINKEGERRHIWSPDRNISAGVYFAKALHFDGTTSRTPLIYVK